MNQISAPSGDVGIGVVAGSRVRPGQAATAPGSGPGTAVSDPRVELQRLEQRHCDLLRAVAVHDELAQLALNGASFARVATLLARAVGNPVLIENRFFRVLAYAWPAGPPAREDRPPTARGLLKDPLVQRLWPRLEREWQVLEIAAAPERGILQAWVIAPVVVSDAVVGYVSVLERDRPLGSDDLTLAREASFAIGLQFVREQAAIEAELRVQGNLLDVVLRSAEAPPDVRATRSALLAHDSGAPQTVIVVALDPPLSETELRQAPSLQDLAVHVSAWARRVAAGSLVAEKDGQIVVLLADGPRTPRPRQRAADQGLDAFDTRASAPSGGLDQAQTSLTDALRQEIASVFPDWSCSMAVAPPVRDARELRRVYGVARRALGILALLGERGQVISTTDPRLAVFMLFDSARPEARREFVDLVLGPLIAYDQRGRRSLVATLAGYLECGGNLESTARLLNVHTSTLKYRLQRIAEISGLDVRNADHRFNAALALRLRTLDRG